MTGQDTRAVEHGNKIALLQAFVAYGMWGFLPLFFRQLSAVGPMEIVANRIIWSLVLLLILLTVRRRLAALWEALTTRAMFWPMAASAVLIAANWLIYIWAVEQGQVVAASLGYFLNPLVNVLLGMLFLKERLSRTQWISVAIAGSGVAVLAAGSLGTLWISLSLAASFGTYGLIRKMAPVGPMVGLASETVILAPSALSFLLWVGITGDAAFNFDGARTDLFLLASGVITAIPLLLFASAARKLRYSTLGLIQYIAPTIVFLIAVFVFDEPLTTAHYVAFAFIWAALGLYSFDTLRQSRGDRATPEEPPSPPAAS